MKTAKQLAQAIAAIKRAYYELEDILAARQQELRELDLWEFHWLNELALVESASWTWDAIMEWHASPKNVKLDMELTGDYRINFSDKRGKLIAYAIRVGYWKEGKEND